MISNCKLGLLPTGVRLTRLAPCRSTNKLTRLPPLQEYDQGLITPEQFAEDIEAMMRKLYETYSNTLPCAGCNNVHKITLCVDKPCLRYCEECRVQHSAKEVSRRRGSSQIYLEILRFIKFSFIIENL